MVARRDWMGAAGLMVLAAVALARYGAIAQPYPDFTQLWIVPSQSEQVRIGTRNGEGVAIGCHVVLQRPGQVIGEWSIQLGPGDTWEEEVALPDLVRPGAEVLLYRAEAPSVVYRRVDAPPRASGSG